MTKLRQNLKNLMAKGGHNTYDIYRMTGIPAATTHRFLSGEIGDPRSATVKKWALAYNLTESQLRGDMPIDGLEQPEANQELKDLLPLDEFQHISVLKRMDSKTKGMLYQLANHLAENQADYTPERRRKSVMPNPSLRIGEERHTPPPAKLRKKTADEGRRFHGSKSSRTA